MNDPQRLVETDDALADLFVGADQDAVHIDMESALLTHRTRLAGELGRAGLVAKTVAAFVLVGGVAVAIASLLGPKPVDAPSEPFSAAAPAVIADVGVGTETAPSPVEPPVQVRPQSPAIEPIQHGDPGATEEEATPLPKRRSPSAKPAKKAKAAPAHADEAAPDDALEEQMRLARATRRAWDRNDPLEAERLARLSLERYPKGYFREEVSALRSLALAKLGRDAEAKRSADEFLRRYPSSPFARLVKAAQKKISGS